MKRMVAVLSIVVLAIGVTRVGAGQLGAQIPANCVAHITFDSGPDLAEDYRCAGIAIEYHTAGVAFSPGPIWAGQWLFVDEADQFRVGSCVFNRGLHPTIAVPSSIVAQGFPNDPTGAKSAYLTWRYGDTIDDLTAAAMWAVMHYYAQDGAGTRRATNGGAPLVPSLDTIAVASGRDDIQAMAVALDAEANRYAGEWAITVAVDVNGGIEARLTAAGQPFAAATVTLLMSGQDDPAVLTTDADGIARATMPAEPGPMTVVASAHTPSSALVYRGTPAGPDPHGAQRLVTGGAPALVTATATADVPQPTTTSTTTSTTSTTTSTTVPETSTASSTTTTATTTTTLPAETSTTASTLPPDTLPPDTLPPDTLPPDTEPPDTLPPTTPPPTPTSSTPVQQALPSPPRQPLPKTGKASDSISFLATALLVAGIGIVGVAGRRTRTPAGKEAHLHSTR